ncbi:phage tail protein I [Escherichia coli]|nr:phage tail protein I [Escherichia coli]
MNAQLTEIMRLITNLIRTGVVTEVDRENWLCRVKTGELETNWISWLTLRAGNARTWWRPSEGEQVVLLSLGGNLETAFALPAIYSNQFAPPSTSADACVTEHPDGGWFEYEPATGRWYVRGIKSMVIEAADNITMKTSEFVLEADHTRINSEVVINGGVTTSAVRRVVEPFGFLIRIIEWWQTGETPGTFRLDIGVQDQGITEDTYLELERLISDAKPCSRHMIGMSINLQTSGPHWVGAASYLGEEITIYRSTA